MVLHAHAQYKLYLLLEPCLHVRATLVAIKGSAALRWNTFV